MFLSIGSQRHKCLVHIVVRRTRQRRFRFVFCKPMKLDRGCSSGEPGRPRWVLPGADGGWRGWAAPRRSRPSDRAAPTERAKPVFFFLPGFDFSLTGFFFLGPASPEGLPRRCGTRLGCVPAGRVRTDSWSAYPVDRRKKDNGSLPGLKKNIFYWVFSPRWLGSPCRRCGRWRAGRCCTPSSWWRSANRAPFANRKKKSFSFVSAKLGGEKKTSHLLQVNGQDLLADVVVVEFVVAQSDVDVQRQHFLFPNWPRSVTDLRSAISFRIS